MTSEPGELWDIPKGTIYLNHGSFGPAPRPVLEALENYQRRCQTQPMQFFVRDAEELIDEAVGKLAKLLQTRPAHLALVQNATVAMNAAARSVPLSAGDEVLLTDHEYGAVCNIWRDRCRESGAVLRQVTLPSAEPFLDDPAGNGWDEAVVRTISDAITPAVKVLVVSHITSPTSIVLPVQSVCRAARAKGVISVIDGPHAVGLVPVRPTEIGCDYYCASCHKWLSAALGSGFLWVHPRRQAEVRSPIVSWQGSLSGRSRRWQDHFNWLGTMNPAAMLTVGDAADFWSETGLRTLRQHSMPLLDGLRERFRSQAGIRDTVPPANRAATMLCVELPATSDWKPGYHGCPDPLAVSLQQRHGIEILCGTHSGRRLLRISAHLYNTADDLNRLFDAVTSALASA